MYYVYLLLSQKTGQFYLGYTSDLRKRLEQHNSGKSIATNRDKKDAMERERNLKYHGQGIRRLKERLTESISSANCVRGKGEKVR